MTGKEREQAILDYLAGLLNAEQAREVERLCAEDPSFREELEAARTGMLAAESAVAGMSAPQELRQRIQDSLDAEDLRTASKSSRDRLIPFPFKTLVAAAAALALLLGVYFSQQGTFPLASALANDYNDVVAGEMAFNFCQKHCEELSEFCKSMGEPLKLDKVAWQMGDFSFVGGSVHEFNNCHSALFAYRNASDELVVCQLFKGEEQELVQNCKVVSSGPAKLYLSRHDGMLSVTWKDESLMCAITSRIEEERLLDLARKYAEVQNASAPRS